MTQIELARQRLLDDVDRSLESIISSMEDSDERGLLRAARANIREVKRLEDD